MDHFDLAFDVQAKMIEMFGAKGVYHCDKHGEYDGWERNHRCGKCVSIEKEREERQQAIARQAAIQAARWAESGMPSKFCGINLNDWHAQTAEQKSTLEVARKFAKGDVKRLLLIGNCGTGKTMLAAGMIGEMALNGLRPVYSTSARLIRSIRDTWSKKESEQQAMDRFIGCDVLVVDELGAGRCTEDDKLMLSEILCDRYSSDMPTLLISNMNAQQLKEKVLDERAVDRMREGGVVKAMKWQSYRGLKVVA